MNSIDMKMVPNRNVVIDFLRRPFVLLFVWVWHGLTLQAGTPGMSVDPSIPYDFRSDTFDILHTHLESDFSSFASKNIKAHTRLDIVRKSPSSPLRIDLLHFTVDSVLLNGNHVSYMYDDSQIVVPTAVLAPVNDTFSIDVFFRGTPTQIPGDWGGFYWNSTYAFNIGVSFSEDQHSFGRCWFPCFDNFTERSTFSFSIITDTSRRAVCGGILIADTLLSPTRRIAHWSLNTPIPSYLASVSISDYAHLQSNISGLLGPIPVSLYARTSDTTALKNSFLHLPDALHIFEDLFGPYRFQRIGYSVVPFSAGAMEHACNISYMQAAVNGTLAYESLMAHELSHHWFGNLVTCESASDMWLNEGWASYCEHLFAEGLYGKDAYKTLVRNNHSNILQYLHTTEGYLAVSGVPSEKTYGSTVYDKGADVIHSLRSYMGDTQFSHLISEYLDSFAFKHTNSLLFRDFLTRNGFNANNFFENWILNPGFPHFSIDHWYWESGTLHVYVRQRLRNAPHLYAGVPLELSVFHNTFSPTVFPFVMSEDCNHLEFSVSQPPTFIALDFDEKISDAISDEYLNIKSVGVTPFSIARITLDVNAISDSILFRAEHHFMAPDKVASPLPYRINNYRYWTIDGTWDTTFLADIVFPFNASVVPGRINHLDTSFYFTSEDSLVLLYRKNASYNWQLADSFRIDKQTNATDKVGRAIAYTIKKGDYALGVVDPFHPDWSDEPSTSNCLKVGFDHPLQSINTLKLYPNPVSDILFLEGLNQEVNFLKVCDMRGRKVQVITRNTNPQSIDVHRLDAGMYVLYVEGLDKQRQSVVFIKE